MRTKNSILAIIILFLSFFIEVNAQLSESFFSNSEQEEGGKINCHLKFNNTIIIGALSSEKTKNKPAVICIDTFGNTIWNTAITDTNSSLIGHFVYKMILGKDGFIYAFCADVNFSKQIWKLNPLNGQFVWRKKLNLLYADYTLPRYLIDYDTSKILISYFASYDGLTLKANVAFINKNNGDTSSTLILGDLKSGRNRYGLGIDNNKNIYYTNDDSVFKFDANNFNNKLWKTKYNGLNMEAYHHVYFDSARNSIILFGNTSTSVEKGLIAKVNAFNGSLMSSFEAYNDAVEFQDMKVFNDNVYVTWRHYYVGGGDKRYWTTSYNLVTGKANWDIDYKFSGVGFSSSHSGNSQSAMSMDVDNIGNIYLTGYYGDANYGPENWGILKLEGSTGKALYERTVKLDTMYYDDISIGMASCVFNNTPYFIGELETTPSKNGSYAKSKLTFVKAKAISGYIDILKYIDVDSNFQFQSKTISIENYGTDNLLILKQIGRSIKLELLNKNKNLVWEKTFLKEYFLIGGVISSNSNGEIFLSANSSKESNIFPFYSDITDTLYIFNLNKNGTLIKEYKFELNSFNGYPKEMYSDNNSTFIFYTKQFDLFFRKISSNSLSNEFHTGKNTNNVNFKTKYCANNSNLFIQIYGSNYYSLINKSTMNIDIDIKLVNHYNTLNYVQEIDTNLVLLCGKNASNYESIGLYNTTLKDTLWSKILSNSNNSYVVKCVIDKSKKYVYLISSNSGNIIVRKLSINTGIKIWEYTYNGAANLEDFPYDISFNNIKSRIYVSGYEALSNNNKQVIIITLDSSGKILQTIKRPGSTSGENYAYCSNVSGNNTTWVGGALSKSTYGLSGFVFEVDTTTTTSTNKRPIAIDDNSQTIKNTSIFVSVLGNDFDTDINDTISLTKIVIAPKNGTAIKLTNQIKYQPSNNFVGKDSFDYEISDINGFKDSARVYIDVTNTNSISIKEINEIKIYPNPFSYFTNILFNDPLNQGTIVIYNLMGQIVKKVENLKCASVMFFKDKLESGVYYLKIYDNNKDVGIEKIVIED